ncbi:uncharacterized protein TM35_000221640 [Trypanosoma theileri]|uniref:Uncharacterized protein n=1 Tax=Trypanosoma theileri TaxID=67003 RepID=A0A1X0NRM8_9TRYP|nr:uncharacterized protein TM35_000221640 [Trypanosoma theileri]ORC87365.1 hypothetical protein TM35_000221640 [Trypanosoma theileri]
MQEDTSPVPIIRVDEDMIHHDAYRLILDNTHTTAELLELLGSTSPSKSQTPQGTAKRVRISEEVTVFNDQPVELLHLPPAVALLYHAALADAPVKKVSTLLHMLERLGEPPTPRARGNILHEEGMRRIQDIAKWREEQQKAMIEQETKECTFKPTISDSAKQIAPKGLKTFMEKCIEWRKSADMRLQKKVAQDRINRGEDEIMTQWKMNDRSRQVLEKLKKKGIQRSKLWEPKTVHSADSLTSNKVDASDHHMLIDSTVENNMKDVLASPSFHPVIHSAVGDALIYLQQCDKRNLIKDKEDNNTNNKNNDDKDDTVLCRNDSNNSNNNKRRGIGVVRAYLQRVEDDKERRQVRLKKLRAFYAKQAKEQLYEKNTGQPLFQPNSMPTVLKNGKRVNFDELDKEEQQQLVKTLQLQHQEHVIARYMSSQRERDEKLQPRTPDKLVADLLNQSERQRRLEALRSEIDVEETFHPEISRKARRIIAKKSWRPIYERPLPQRQQETSRSSSTTPKGKSSNVCIQRMLARTENWMQQRSQHLQQMREALEEEMAANCSFHPQRDSSIDMSRNSKYEKNKNDNESHNSSISTQIVDNDALVASAESRMYTELELLRSQAALRDRMFMKAIKEPLTAVTLATAPRPSRRSVEEYTRSQSSITSLRPTGSSSCQPQRRGYSLSTSFVVYSDNENENDDDDGNDDDDYYYYNGVTSGEHSTQYIDYGEASEGMQEIADSWALLDAQTDAILKKCQYY